MGVTYVSAAARDERRNADSDRCLGERHLVLVITSILAAFSIGLSYAGRLAAERYAESSRHPAHVINLNVVTDSQEIEPLFDPMFANALDRRFAAERLLEFIRSMRRAGDTLPNV